VRPNIIALVRSGEDIATALAESTHLSRARVAGILADPSGQALAIACKGAGLNRAAFSAIALLSAAGANLEGAYAMLDAFDAVPLADAARQVRLWRDTLPAAAE
jgi:hypothetical protein